MSNSSSWRPYQVTRHDQKIFNAFINNREEIRVEWGCLGDAIMCLHYSMTQWQRFSWGFTGSGRSGFTLHISAGDIAIGKSCPPLDAKTEKVSLTKPVLEVEFDVESLSLRTQLAGHCRHIGLRFTPHSGVTLFQGGPAAFWKAPLFWVHDRTCKYNKSGDYRSWYFFSVCFLQDFISSTPTACQTYMHQLLQLQLSAAVPQFTSHLTHVTDRNTTSNFHETLSDTSSICRCSCVALEPKSALSPYASCKPDFHLAFGC